MGSKRLEIKNEKDYNKNKEDDMIDNRTIAILMELFANQKMSLYELSIQTGIDKEQLRYRLDEVNQLLEEQDFPRLDLQDDFYQVPVELLEQSQYLFELFRSRQIYLS